MLVSGSYITNKCAVFCVTTEYPMISAMAQFRKCNKTSPIYIALYAS